MRTRKTLRLLEIAELLGVSRQYAHQLRRRPDFPAPVERYSRGNLWAASDVKRWARRFEGGSARWRPRLGSGSKSGSKTTRLPLRAGKTAGS
jgi:predicted DNA-binding transcriptional regulator AlpA